MNQIHTARAGSPRSAAICIGTLCRWGLVCSTRVRAAVFRVQRFDHVRTDADKRVGAHHAARLRAASPRDRDWSGR